MTTFRYGSYDHTDNEVNLVSMTKETTYSPRGASMSKVIRMVAVGHICDSNSTSLLQKIEDIYDAYLRNDASSAGLVGTPHFIYAKDTMDGIRVVSVDFPEGAPGELATGRTYRIVLEANIRAIQDQIVWFTQTMTHIGSGGVAMVIIPRPTGPPMPVWYNASTPMKVIQHGQAIGMEAWPTLPAPFWGSYEILPERRIAYTSPRRINRTGKSYRNFEFPMSWSYTFEMPNAINPLVTPSYI